MAVHEVRKRLAKSDILVTNQGDKVVQLAKIVRLHNKAQQVQSNLSKEARTRWSALKLSQRFSGSAASRPHPPQIQLWI